MTKWNPKRPLGHYPISFQKALEHAPQRAFLREEKTRAKLKFARNWWNSFLAGIRLDPQCFWAKHEERWKCRTEMVQEEGLWRLYVGFEEKSKVDFMPDMYRQLGMGDV